MEPTDIITRLAVALAIGLLVGLERGWRTRDEEEHQRAAGFRTFALSGLLGGISGALSLQLGSQLVSFVFIGYSAAFAAFQRSQEEASAIEHRFLMAQVPNMVGWLYQQLGDYARALQFDQEGVEIAQRSEKTPAEISARINVALDIL